MNNRKTARPVVADIGNSEAYVRSLREQRREA
jgi:hypothetical protein